MYNQPPEDPEDDEEEDVDVQLEYDYFSDEYDGM